MNSRKVSSRLSVVVIIMMLVFLTHPSFALKSDTTKGLQVIETKPVADVTMLDATEGRILFYDFVGNYGYLDYNGEVAIPARYSFANLFSSGVALVNTDKGQAYIDKNGEIQFYISDIINQFDKETEYPEVYGFYNGYARVNTVESTGYINTKGKFVIPMNTYSNGYDFGEGLTQVFDEDGSSYFINVKGEKLFDANPDLSYEKFKDGFSVVYNYDNGQYGYVNTSGELIVSTSLDAALDFVGQHALYQELGKYGVLNSSGKFVLHPTYQRAEMTNDGFILGFDGVFTTILNQDLKPVYMTAGDLTMDYFDNVFIERNGNKFEFKDFSGQKLGQFDDYQHLGDYMFDSGSNQLISSKHIEQSFPENNELKIHNKYAYKFLNNKGEVVIDLSEYERVRPFSGGRAVVEKDGKFGYIDTTGKIVIPLKYTLAEDFNSGEAYVQIGEKTSFIDPDGKVLESEIDYIDVNPDSEFYVISAESDDTSGFYSKVGVAKRSTNQIVLEPTYSSITHAGSGIFEIRDTDYKYGIYNANTGQIIEPQYEYMTIYPEENRVLVETADFKKGILDISGKVILEPVYSYIGLNYDGLYELEKETGAGIATRDGQIVLDAVYQNIDVDDFIEGSLGNVIMFSTEKDDQLRTIAYDKSKKTILFDNIKGYVSALAKDYFVVTDREGSVSVVNFDGKVTFKTTDTFVERQGDYLHFEKTNGIDYLATSDGTLYLENNAFTNIYLPVEDKYIIFYKDSGYGIVHINGEVTSSELFNSVSYIDSGIMSTYHKGVFSYVHVNGKHIIDQGAYDYLYRFTDGLGLVIKIIE